MAECAYSAIFAMRDPKGKTASDIFPSIFEDDENDTDTDMSDEEIAENIAIMDAINAENEKSETQP
jgi:hypothetical protein